jgi:hypothetical protein
MKNLIFRIVTAVVLTVTVISHAQATGESIKQESPQNKKEKKPKVVVDFDWEKIRPKQLSGVEDMDKYILYCDTVWERILTYRESITFFKLDTFYSPKDDCMLILMRDEKGNVQSKWRTLLQRLNIGYAGALIGLDGITINLLATNAGLSVVNNPLLAFNYSKCLTGGPVIAGIAIGEVKEIARSAKNQANQIKQLQAGGQVGSTDKVTIRPVEGEIPSDAEIIEDLEAFILANSGDEKELTPEEKAELKRLEAELERSEEG